MFEFRMSRKKYVNRTRTAKHAVAASAVNIPKRRASIFIIFSSLILSIYLTSVLYHISQNNPSYSLRQQLSFLLVSCNMLLATSIVNLYIKNLVLKTSKPLGDFLILAAITLCGGVLVLLYSFQPLLLSLILITYLGLLIVSKRLFKNYSFAGLNFYQATVLMLPVGLTWGVVFLMSLNISLMTRLILLCTTPLLFINLPSDFLQMFELFDIVTRDKWLRPRKSYPRRIYYNEPFVSLHVPTYSEPPELVIETLDKLAKLNYTNYEVIVIDNNTKDSSLYLPVKEHCRKLGGKFRFYHADGISGAKGGALNYIMPIVHPKTTIIGVIDADYQVEPEFLKALVGYFDNSKIGFVQTPHDYREWKGSLFLTMCYWEYKIFFHSAMISLSERDAGITVGTMCLIRKEALERAGGWSEWCVTEDSELAIRIHDVGYSSVYVDETFGRGLIPDTFEGYKKQRYRWTAGPVQEFRYHFKNFIGTSNKDSKFTFTQRIYHLNHGLNNVLLGLDIPLQIIGILLLSSLIIHKEIIKVPFEMWLAATVMLLTTPLLTLLMYKSTVKPKIKHIIGQLFASKALNHVITYSALKTNITGSAAWNRTSKFKSKHTYSYALYSTKEEIMLGLGLAAFMITAYALFPYDGLTLMLIIGLCYSCFNYFAAPVMAMIGVWSAKQSDQFAKEGDYLEQISNLSSPILTLSTEKLI